MLFTLSRTDIVINFAPQFIVCKILSICFRSKFFSNNVFYPIKDRHLHFVLHFICYLKMLSIWFRPKFVTLDLKCCINVSHFYSNFHCTYRMSSPMWDNFCTVGFQTNPLPYNPKFKDPEIEGF